MAKISIKGNSKLFNILLSLLLAFLVWLTLSVTAFPETSVSLKEVAIDYSLSGSYADVAGISILSKSNETANLKISGLRYLIGEYTAEDISVHVNLDTVRAPGSYELPLVVTDNNGNEIKIDEIVPSTVKVDFDYLVTKEFSVANGTLTADISNLAAGQGYVIDPSEVEISPTSVSVYGPKDYVDQITHCVARYGHSATVTSSVENAKADLLMYNGDSVFENEKVTANTEELRISVPVYYRKNLALDIEIQSYFNSFDISTLKYEISPDSIAVRSLSNKLSELERITLGYVELRQVTVGTTFTVPIGPNSNYENISGIDLVTVSFPLEGYGTKSVSIKNSQIYAINMPQGYRLAIDQNRINNVTLVGPQQVLDSIESGDVIAEIDMLDYNVGEGASMFTVSIYVPGHDDVWAYGIYRVSGSIETAAE